MGKVYSMTDTLSMMMMSDNYKERFLAEYLQVVIRLNRLNRLFKRLEGSVLPFKPNCPLELLRKQADVMLEYARILEERAKYEDIEMPAGTFDRE